MNKFLEWVSRIALVVILVLGVSMICWLCFEIGVMSADSKHDSLTVMKDHVCKQVTIQDNTSVMAPWNIIPVEGYKLYSCKENNVH